MNFYIPLRSLQASRGRDDPQLQIPLLLFKAVNTGLRPFTFVRPSVCLSVSLPPTLFRNELFKKFSPKAAPSLLRGVPQGPSASPSITLRLWTAAHNLSIVVTYPQIPFHFFCWNHSQVRFWAEEDCCPSHVTLETALVGAHAWISSSHQFNEHRRKVR